MKSIGIVPAEIYIQLQKHGLFHKFFNFTLNNASLYLRQKHKPLKNKLLQTIII
jgi:hypothetical protein